MLSPPAEPRAEEETELDTQLNSSYIKALEGFLVVLSEDGDMIYLSENVNKCLGLAQVGPASNIKKRPWRKEHKIHGKQHKIKYGYC